MSDLEEAKALIAARVAELDARFKGRDGLPVAWFSLTNGGHAIYLSYRHSGLYQQGDPTSLAPTAVDAAKGWVACTESLDLSRGILHWRRRPLIEQRPAVSFEQSAATGFGMSPPGWVVHSRLVIVEGEPELEPEDLHTFPEDYPGWDEMVATYLKGVPAA